MHDADLHEGIDSTIPLIQHQLKQGISIVKEYGQIPTVMCYPSRMNQVFLNLLVNAVQAIEGEGSITIRTSADDDAVRLKFIDTGNGIPKENLDRVFDPGFTTKGVGVGTGLGLPICYQIIQDHRGEISIESEVGKGTTVTVSLPTNEERRDS
jgi:signal transduction histidine kinase